MYSIRHINKTHRTVIYFSITSKSYGESFYAYMFGQYKMSLALQDFSLFEQATLQPQLTIFRTLSGATALSV